MTVRKTSRTIIDTYLKLVRAPIDALIERLPGDDAGVAPAARLAVDRADVSVRSALASILRDGELRKDADRRDAAAEQHERAMRLREQAARTADKADARLQEREEAAERQRSRARQDADNRRERAERERKQKTKQAAVTERKRLDASRKASATAEQSIDQRATEARLETLETKSDALRDRKHAMAAGDEARRLADAAARVKAERKNSN